VSLGSVVQLGRVVGEPSEFRWNLEQQAQSLERENALFLRRWLGLLLVLHAPRHFE
jgi:hypothetical protein